MRRAVPPTGVHRQNESFLDYYLLHMQSSTGQIREARAPSQSEQLCVIGKQTSKVTGQPQRALKGI